jgi:hypothetical protein
VRELEVFAEICCPFTHVGLRRFVERRLLERSDHPVLRVRAWPLELVNGAPLDAGLVAEEVEELRDQVAPDLFVGFAPERFPRTSLPAMALAAHAYGHGADVGERTSLALRDALFEDGRDIADPAVLRSIACGVGLPWPPVDGGDVAAPVLADWRDGRVRGVLGSPHFFVDGTGFFCPMLSIERVGERRRIALDRVGLGRFLERCFR